MGAAEKIDEKKVEVAFEPTIELKTVNMKPTVVVSFPEEVFINKANEAGIDEKTLSKISKFNGEFIKELTTKTADAIIPGYAQHKDATHHLMEYKTPLNSIKIQGGKTEHSAAFGTTNTGLRVAIITTVRGLNKITTDKKKEIFEATREK